MKYPQPGDTFKSRDGHMGARVESVEGDTIHMYRWKINHNPETHTRFTLTLRDFAESSWVKVDEA